MIIVNTDNMRIVGGMNTKSISFDVEGIPVEVDFGENIRDIIKCLREIGYDL